MYLSLNNVKSAGNLFELKTKTKHFKYIFLGLKKEIDDKEKDIVVLKANCDLSDQLSKKSNLC